MNCVQFFDVIFVDETDVKLWRFKRTYRQRISICQCDRICSVDFKVTENVCAEVTSVVERESDVTTGLAGEGDSNASSIEMLEVRRRDEESIFAPRTAKLEIIIKN